MTTPTLYAHQKDTCGPTQMNDCFHCANAFHGRLSI